MALPWRDWAEWEEVYAALFALDDDAARRAGLQRVITWRTRGRVPLAVETTATFVELELSDRARDAAGCALSDHSLSLTYAMALTRLVNGVVDPLQQRARAVSVQKLAADVALPASLVAVRHEATHNRLPSLPTLRLATQQAMLWLHERYWWPQLQLHRSLPSLVEESLRKCHAAADRRSSSRVPRWRVVTCAAQLARKLEPCHARLVLIPMLLDSGFLAPPAGAAPQLFTATATAPIIDHDKVVASMRLWFRLLRQLQQSWPLSHLGGVLLVECVRRLATEPEIDLPPAAPEINHPSAGSQPLSSISSLAPGASLHSTPGDRPVSRRDVLHACAAYALAQPWAAAGRPQGLRVGRAHLLQAASILSSSSFGSGQGATALLSRVLTSPEWPLALLAPCRELLAIRQQADALGASAGSRKQNRVGQRASPWRMGGATPKINPTPAIFVVPLPGGVWGRCERWAAAPIGAAVVLDSRHGPRGARAGGAAETVGATVATVATGDVFMDSSRDASRDTSRDSRQGAGGLRTSVAAATAGSTGDTFMVAAADTSRDASMDTSMDMSTDVSGDGTGGVPNLVSRHDIEASLAAFGCAVAADSMQVGSGDQPTMLNGQRVGIAADGSHSPVQTGGEDPFEIEPLLAPGESAGARFAR
jgi:hypothetical protein